MLRLLSVPRRFTEGRFWSLYVFAETLMVLDCFTTVIILYSCGGVELNPVVNYFGLFNITVYKILATAFVGFVSRVKKFLWLLFGLSFVFSFVVLWNTVNLLLVL
jgi:hypothetical protein